MRSESDPGRKEKKLSVAKLCLDQGRAPLHAFLAPCPAASEWGVGVEPTEPRHTDGLGSRLQIEERAVIEQNVQAIPQSMRYGTGLGREAVVPGKSF